MSDIHLIVRALIVKSNQILLLKPSQLNKDFSHELCFLPGGHVERGESAKHALKRELTEELGMDCAIEQCMGMLECTWNRKGSLYHELNLIFLVNEPSLSTNNPPSSKEKHIQFFWHPVDELKGLTLLPKTLIQAIPTWLKNQPVIPLLFSEMTFSE